MAGYLEGWAPQSRTGLSPPGWLMREAPAINWLLIGLRQHKWAAAGVWLAITVGAAACIWGLPSTYQAEAIVLIESRRIPQQLAPDTREAGLEGRLEAAHQQLLSSAELRATISKLRLYAEPGQSAATPESLAAKIRENLTIAPIAPISRGQPSPLRVTFRWENAETAARVANHLAWRFVEEISTARRLGSRAAAQFLATQVVSAKRELEQREATLREFLLRYTGELPDQSEALRATAWRLRSELATLRGEMLKLEREKSALEEAERVARTQEATGEKPRPETSGVGLANGATARRPLLSQEFRKRLIALLAVYKPEHPDVRRLMAEAAQAETPEAEAEARWQVESGAEGPQREPSPRTEQTSGKLARLKEIDTCLEDLASRRVQLAAELGLTEQRLQRVPLREQELAALMREHSFLSERYRTVAARHQSAEMAEALERSYPAERVTVVDQARPPEKPLGPSRWVMLSVASLAGLAIGCLLAAARGYSKAAWSQLEPGDTFAPHETSPYDARAEKLPLASGATGRSFRQMARGG